MKTTQILSFGAVLTVAVAQTLQSLPDCGKLCVNNMLAKAKQLGCADGDAACLCRNIDFAYGIRDCSTEVCGPQQALTVIAYGESYCKSGGVGTGGGGNTTIPSPNPPSSSTSIQETTISPSKTVGSSSAIATSALVSLVTSGTEVYTSTASLTTIFSGGPSTSPSSDTSSVTSNIGSSPTSTSESESSSSTGSGAKPTAFAGLAAAAGIAAMIL